MFFEWRSQEKVLVFMMINGLGRHSPGTMPTVKQIVIVSGCEWPVTRRAWKTSSNTAHGKGPFTDTLFPFWTETVPTVPSAAFADRANKTKSKVLKPLMTQRFYIVINSICKLTKFSPKHQIFLALFWPMRSITPPRARISPLSTCISIEYTDFTQIYFFGECAKKASRLFEV